MGFAFALVLVFGLAAQAGYVYKVNEKHQGGNVTPVEAYKMLEKNPKHTFLVDCRTRYEYQVVGHPMNAYNVPTKFFTTKVGKKGYGKSVNANFGKDLLVRFNPKTDTLLFMCRSGNRSCTACDMAIKVGWPKNKVFNIMGGFEGGKNKNKFSAFHGQRWAGGWRLEGLPWTYKMDKKFMYKADLK
jgi:rhodanese-related sulfurtransferase